MSSQHSSIKCEGQCKLRMDRLNWKGNIKLKRLGQIRLAGSGEKCDIHME